MIRSDTPRLINTKDLPSSEHRSNNEMKGVQLAARCSSRLSCAMADQLKVLHKSNDIIVLDKHFDMKINSNDPRDTRTVDKLLTREFPLLVDPTVEFGFRFAHRLDHATSGVLCIALNSKTSGRFGKLFSKRRVTKHYLALVWGHLQQRNLLLDIAIGPDSSETEIHKMCVASSPHCIQPIKSCVTIAVCLETGLYMGNPASKLLLIPLTGRTHQLRVHCCHIGHRIIGDYMYSGRIDTRPPRMMLHSYRIHVPFSPKPLDVFGPDYFVPELVAGWTPVEVHTTYQQFCKAQYSLEDRSLKLNLDNMDMRTVTLDKEQ